MQDSDDPSKWRLVSGDDAGAKRPPKSTSASISKDQTIVLMPTRMPDGTVCQ